MTHTRWIKPTQPATPTVIITLLCLCLLFLGAGIEAQTSRSPVTIKKPAPAHDGVEIAQMPGFPIVLEPYPVEPGASYSDDLQWSVGGAVLANLDGTGDLEIVHSYAYNAADTAEPGGRVWAWDSSGNPLPGFPVVTEGGAYYPPSVSDIDGDGDLEIVQLTKVEGEDNQQLIQLSVIDHRGHILRGFPKLVGSSVFLEGVTMYDLDHNGTEELIFGSFEGLQILNHHGVAWNLDFDTPTLGVGIPSIGDLDGDGEPEIFVTGMHSMHLVRADGSALPGWPIDSSHWLELGWMSAAALADLDNDLDLEVIVAGLHPGEDFKGDIEVHVYHHDGSVMAGWPVRISFSVDLFEAFCSSRSPSLTA